MSAEQDVDFDQIKTAPYNPRKDLKPHHREYQQLEANLLKFGFLGGMVWNKRTGNLVGGHQRLKVMIAHRHTSAPMRVVDLDDGDEKQLNLSLNKIGEGSWDNATLSEVLAELRHQNIELDVTGFTNDEADNLISEHLNGISSPIPEPEQDDPLEQPAVLVLCENKAEQKRLARQLRSEGYTCATKSAKLT